MRLLPEGQLLLQKQSHVGLVSHLVRSIPMISALYDSAFRPRLSLPAERAGHGTICRPDFQGH